MRIKITIILAAIILSANSIKAQDWIEKTLVHDGETREYVLHIPDVYDGNTKVPLMLNFHGFGGYATEYMKDADLRSLADSENFILVYPQGTLLDGYSHWNAALPGGDNKSEADDFGFVEALINELSAIYNIDTARVYACGFSNGGMLTYALAQYKGDLIAAVGIVSGAMLDLDAVPSRPVPVVIVHGTSDKVLPYYDNFYYNSVEDALNFWINFSNTNTTPVVNSFDDEGMLIEHYHYADGDRDVSVEHYKLNGGTHFWHDTLNYQGANTSRLIWEFVSKYDMNGLR
jgi:polyhydroxybutyrate depolymerase